MRYVVIMAGGSGTRLWPLSRRGTPKQLLGLVGGRSLLQLAVERALGLVGADRVLVVTGADYAGLVAGQLPELDPANILGEPEGRDSLNAVAWPAAVLYRRDPEAVIAQLTADQLIEPVEVFTASLRTAFEVAEAHHDALVTLGVVPTEPHTGYGYLHRGRPLPDFPEVCELAGFTEKPPAELAAEYLASGEYWWNAGLFVWRAATILEQLRLLLPQTYATVLELADHPERVADLFGTLVKISVDYAVMEPVSRGAGSATVVAVPLPVEWSDVGGYASLAGVLGADDLGNAVEGRTVLLDSSDSVVVNADPGAVIGVVGAHGLVVVRTGTATLVVPTAMAERVKDLVAAVREQAGEQWA